jgi:hypothetical protein
VTGKGEARTALLEGTEAGAAGPIIKASGVGAKDRQRLIQRTAVYGPVRTVVWEGRSREAPPYPDSGAGRPLTSLKKSVAPKFLGYETKPDGATEHQTDR